MAIPTVAVKKTAKTVLKGNYLSAVLVCFLLLGVITVCFYISFLFSFASLPVVGDISFALLSVFIISPLLLGIIRYFRRLVWEKSPKASEVFLYFCDFSQYLRVLKLIASLFLRLILSAFAAFFPAVILRLLTSDLFFDALNIKAPLWIENLGFLKTALMLIGGIITVIFMLRFYLSAFLITADDNISPAEAIHLSSVISRGSLNEFCALCLSFLGLFLLSVFMIPLFFTLPYFLCCYVVHSRFSVTAYNSKITKTPEFLQNGGAL